MVSNVFSGFVGYSIPEMSKRRKRQVGNISGEVLQQHAKQLFLCLQASYWEKPTWQPCRNDVETLAQYVGYLRDKNE